MPNRLKKRTQDERLTIAASLVNGVRMELMDNVVSDDIDAVSGMAAFIFAAIKDVEKELLRIKEERRGKGE